MPTVRAVDAAHQVSTPLAFSRRQDVHHRAGREPAKTAASVSAVAGVQGAALPWGSGSGPSLCRDLKR